MCSLIRLHPDWNYKMSSESCSWHKANVQLRFTIYCLPISILPKIVRIMYLYYWISLPVSIKPIHVSASNKVSENSLEQGLWEVYFKFLQRARNLRVDWDQCLEAIFEENTKKLTQYLTILYFVCIYTKYILHCFNSIDTTSPVTRKVSDF